MRNDKLIPGLVLVLIGGVILLDNFGYIDFSWGDIWHLWPLFLIIAGVNLLFAHNTSPLATILKISIVIVAFIFVILAYGDFGPRLGFRHNYYGWHHHDGNNDDMDDNDDDDDGSDSTTKSGGIVKVEGSSIFNQPYTADAKIAVLNINGGGTSYTLNDTTNQLFNADTKEFFGKYEFSHHNDGSTYVLDFDMKDKGVHFNWHGDHDKSNEAILKLNVNPLWDINIDAGATAINFDLSKFKVRTVKLDGGAASFDVKMGEPLENTNVNVSTGAASVDIRIPKDAACEIISSGLLSSNNFDDEGFEKKDDDNYQTAGFDQAKNKFHINVSSSMTSVSVHRY